MPLERSCGSMIRRERVFVIQTLIYAVILACSRTESTPQKFKCPHNGLQVMIFGVTEKLYKHITK